MEEIYCDNNNNNFILKNKLHIIIDSVYGHSEICGFSLSDLHLQIFHKIQEESEKMG